MRPQCQWTHKRNNMRSIGATCDRRNYWWRAQIHRLHTYMVSPACRVRLALMIGIITRFIGRKRVTSLWCGLCINNNTIVLMYERCSRELRRTCVSAKVINRNVISSMPHNLHYQTPDKGFVDRLPYTYKVQLYAILLHTSMFFLISIFGCRIREPKQARTRYNKCFLFQLWRDVVQIVR